MNSKKATFVGLLAIFLWSLIVALIKDVSSHFGAVGGGAFDFDWSSSTSLLFAAAAMGFDYAAWNVGILHGSVTLLAGASYFIPVFSAFFSAILLSTPLTISFWYGAFMVCIGSILCWYSTRVKSST
jgi:drug/metabolite transporter (DMT)-like permease